MSFEIEAKVMENLMAIEDQHRRIQVCALELCFVFQGEIVDFPKERRFDFKNAFWGMKMGINPLFEAYRARRGGVFLVELLGNVFLFSGKNGFCFDDFRGISDSRPVRVIIDELRGAERNLQILDGVFSNLATFFLCCLCVELEKRGAVFKMASTTKWRDLVGGYGLKAGSPFLAGLKSDLWKLRYPVDERLRLFSPTIPNSNHLGEYFLVLELMGRHLSNMTLLNAQDYLKVIALILFFIDEKTFFNGFDNELLQRSRDLMQSVELRRVFAVIKMLAENTHCQFSLLPLELR